MSKVAPPVGLEQGASAFNLTFWRTLAGFSGRALVYAGQPTCKVDGDRADGPTCKGTCKPPGGATCP